MAVVLMGVCGSGKSTVGRHLAKTADWEFIDADDHHPETNKQKMAKGIPLTDEAWMASYLTSHSEKLENQPPGWRFSLFCFEEELQRNSVHGTDGSCPSEMLVL
ncbi:probable gluconokinase isoform X6 [Acanthaster planci]|uniref:gluconokinase n=1 Tax=Acanthaster planci TaxID=133434 RepID=A0A8B7ZS56_ACAPL|nr:probable gluconokinase isoform X6 [Acanthaster planci]